jgi:hypothetical protein
MACVLENIMKGRPLMKCHITSITAHVQLMQTKMPLVGHVKWLVVSGRHHINATFPNKQLRKMKE